MPQQTLDREQNSSSFTLSLNLNQSYSRGVF